jgi:hypothetical protein
MGGQGIVLSLSGAIPFSANPPTGISILDIKPVVLEIACKAILAMARGNRSPCASKRVTVNYVAERISFLQLS